MNHIYDFLNNYLFTDDIIKNILGTSGSAAIVGLSVVISKKIKNFLYTQLSSFTLNGYWLAQFTSPHIASDERNFELVVIKQKDEFISLKIFHYSNKHPKIIKFTSSGFYRTLELYTSYLEDNKKKGGGGLFILKLVIDSTRTSKLEGFYVEWDRNCSEPIHVPYALRRVELPVSCRIKLVLPGIKCPFKNYSEIEKFYAES